MVLEAVTCVGIPFTPLFLLPPATAVLHSQHQLSHLILTSISVSNDLNGSKQRRGGMAPKRSTAGQLEVRVSQTKVEEKGEMYTRSDTSPQS